MAKKSDKEVPKRLSPTPDTLRQLYLLSGNNCAVPGCSGLIVDGNGVVLGEVCHIEAAMPNGARFNELQSNEDRRQLSNLVLLCSAHHTQIDSKIYEQQYPLKTVRKIKSDHEAKFKGIGDSLVKAFEAYRDTTEDLTFSEPVNFTAFNLACSDIQIEEEYWEKCIRQIKRFVQNLRKVPLDQRLFMAAVIKRAQKLSDLKDGAIVPANDLRVSIRASVNKLKENGRLLEQYGVGDFSEYAIGGHDEHCMKINDPSDYMTWADLYTFCEATDRSVDEFAINANFGVLGLTET